MRPIIIAILLAAVVALGTFGTGSAAPKHEPETYGAAPGDPRTAADAGECLDAAAAIDGTSCAVLYGHFFDLRSNVPSNTQRPPDDAQDLSRGFAATVGHESRWDLNELTMWSTPGFVEYSKSDTLPTLHTEHGIARDVEIDTDIPLIGYWYLSGDYDEYGSTDGVAGVEPDVGVLPCLTVRMVVQTGRVYGGTGETLAQGSVTKTLVNAKAAGEGDNKTLTSTPCPGAEDGDVVSPEAITEFKIPLEPVAEPFVIPESKGFLIFVEWYQFDPNDDPERPEKVYMTQWNLHSGPDALGRVVFPIKTNLEVEKVEVLQFGGQLYVRAYVKSAWGSHDVDPSSIKMEVYDAAGDAVGLDHLRPPNLRYSTGHDGHFDPVVALFAWDHQAEGLEPGAYTIQVSAKNWQHLGAAAETVQIEVTERNGHREVTPKDGPPQKDVESGETPASGLPALLGLVAALGLAARRRVRAP